MYKIIASDLDETLIGHNHKILDKDIQAIKSLKEEDIFFVCATGRPFKSVDKTLELLDLNDENQYAISFNGGVITENKTHEIIHYDGLDFDTANSLYKRGLEYDVCIHVYTLNKTYVYNFTDEEKQYQEGRQELIEIFEKDLEFIKDEKIIKVLYMNTDYDYLFKIEQEIKDLTTNVDVSYSSNRFIEFNHKGVNKGNALKILADKLNIDINDTIAIGDNYNDLSMIRIAGLGIGVSNTVEDMKKECDIITKASCDEGAITEVIHSYIKNNQLNF